MFLSLVGYFIDNIKNFEENIAQSEREKYRNDKKVYNYIEKEITTNSAKVIVTGNQGDYTVTIVFDLVKEKDHWLIEKFTSN
ncbi:hypothetical protein LZQ00_10340 [Sphingobacterium sp. SRCM116780]|uniref:hypothetical protein n=1 Tax=Sphingobacterium sp. SRCM116780 TaxID=2907623 RepID=UPI001F35586C|nr:hypothetical protein [Sphingobacterium sp. SRCM116780]UIR54674.1 hypothetical protein LZQ00_10340 [Sphingobacterium sp. SRCM116780]